MSMTDQERAVFERLLEEGRRAIRHLGKQMPLAEVLSYSMRYTQASNAAERILDPLRSDAERDWVERQLERDPG